MSKIDELITEISNDTLVKRFQELEGIIDKNQEINRDYLNLLELQKIMVNKKELGSKDFTVAKNNYDKAKEDILKHIVIVEYLDILEEVNYDLNLIQKIITDEINIDFE